MKKPRLWRWAAALIVVLVALAGAGGAQAASVQVQEDTDLSLDDGYSDAVLRFEAAPGEASHLTISVRSEDADFYRLELVETGAELHPGPGCSGGGAPGVVVECVLRRPRAVDRMSCPRSCIFPDFNTGWAISFHILLGDRGSYLDAASIPDMPVDRSTGRPARTVAMEVVGGSGDDRISTAGGDDVIDPGTGSDHVSSHGGPDEIRTTASPDGPDIYELGPGDDANTVDDAVNTVDYHLRSEPVVYAPGRGGAAGEKDRITGARKVVGGSAADTIVGGPEEEVLEGMDGDDELIGNAGGDLLYGGEGDNHLDGGDGNDRLETEVGADRAEGGPDDDALYLGGGPDIGSGGAGHDDIELKAGADYARGGRGDDTIDGDAGADRIFGDSGANSLMGGLGPDLLVGGPDNDVIMAGTTVGYFFLRPREPRDPVGLLDSWSDRIRCGGRGTVVSLNPWDRARNCRTLLPVHAVELGRRALGADAGTATLLVGVRGPGKVTASGPGVRTVVTTLDRSARFGTLDDPLPLMLRLRGRARQRLLGAGRATLRLRLVYRPRGGLPRARMARIAVREATA